MRESEDIEKVDGGRGSGIRVGEGIVDNVEGKRGWVKGRLEGGDGRV